jgi:hypothetical protein
MVASRWLAKRRSHAAAHRLNLPGALGSPPLCAPPRTEAHGGGSGWRPVALRLGCGQRPALSKVEGPEPGTNWDWSLCQSPLALNRPV